MKKSSHPWNSGEEAILWKDALFVFDSSVLLNFYEFSQTAKEEIYTKIFPLLKGRLWITDQIEFEFLKNKARVANKPKDLYNQLMKVHFTSSIRHLDVFYNHYLELKNQTSKPNRHPYLEEEIFKDFDSVIDQLLEKHKLLKKLLQEKIKQRISKYSEEIKDDNLLSFFDVSSGFNFSELLDIVKEGEIRYKYKIPPGYSDEKEKEGIAQFGDLIIWKEVIKLAKDFKKPILLITDDLKEDWYRVDRKDNKKIQGPRFELVDEMKELGNINFWAYNSEQFVSKARSVLKSSISSEVIDEAQKIGQKRRSWIEEAVFQWAKKKYQSDETVWADEFWRKDTGADIIQMLDGVLFSIQIKVFKGRIRLKELIMDIDDIQGSFQSGLGFESHSIVIVADTSDSALSIKNILESRLSKFDLIAGYINDNNEFVEANIIKNS